MPFAQAKLPNPEFDYIPFTGGLDTDTPNWQVKPGTVREAQNFEVGVSEGYQDIQGYERIDGQAAPSDAIYSILDVTITGEFSVGDTITQLVSGATAEVVGVVTEVPAYLVITKITGTFDATNDLQVSSVTEGSSDSLAIADGASTVKLHAQYQAAAADAYRSDITAVPGAGAILGVTMLDDVDYAFRNNAGQTAANLYKTSASGWTQVDLGYEMSFTSGGTYEIQEGDVLTGASSGTTATVARVVTESGTWSGGDAAGRFIFTSAPSGAFTATELLDVSGNPNSATCTADATAITLLPDGRFEFDIYNFGGLTGTKRIYGADGKNRGFEFDGTVFVPIDTGMTTDTPLHVKAHKKHLFFSFEGSAQHSGPSTPYIWDAVFGAAELAVGDTVTGFSVEPGSEGSAALIIFSRNSTHVLYGTSVSDWNLVRYREEVGAYAYSNQQLASTMVLDDRGVTTLNTTIAYGNFKHSTLSGHIQSWVNAQRTKTQASCIVRDKDQYRIFFSDSYALYITMSGNDLVGMMPVLFDNVVSCVYSLEADDGSERIVFGSDNGMVYQMDIGTSFDGEDIEAFLKTHYNHSKSMRWLKKYLSCTMEAHGTGYSEFNFTYELGYNSTAIPQPMSITNTLDFSSAVWDSFVWDAFIWDGVSLSPSTSRLAGSGENISLVVRKTSNYFSPIAFSGAHLRFLRRRPLR
jgi:hypothetical protein